MSDLSQFLKDHIPHGWGVRKLSEMAEAHGLPLSIATISLYLSSKHGKPTHRTLRAFSRLLGIPLKQLHKAAHLPPPHDDYLWTPPREAWQLTKQQGEAVSTFIRAIAEHPSGTLPADVTGTRRALPVRPDYLVIKEILGQ
ncbi:helix-turn-helix transcriptional regulator [Hoyosella altamirensis]|uniref:Transcriptional regulator with XRE-family HTH domain n=1 Tax=Hoyosella altamirensis TaxID=616997 RepID=A0A839RPB2_9ACTN|nr:helix-turn-helix transcriptional regulator [Hoyosella altamirensis]MBB3038360.1 transcriptional regulator with XRE-family HTH domain [Hoyosella altamirensis]